MTKLYIGSCQAAHDGLAHHTVCHLRAENDEDALRQINESMRQLWPPDQGWSGHNAELTVLAEEGQDVEHGHWGSHVLRFTPKDPA